MSDSAPEQGGTGTGLPMRLPQLPGEPLPEAQRLSPEEQEELVHRREREEAAAARDRGCRRQQGQRFLILALTLGAWGWWSADWPCRGHPMPPVLALLWPLLLVAWLWLVLKWQPNLLLGIVASAALFLVFYVGLHQAGLIRLNLVFGLLTALLTVPMLWLATLWALQLE